MRIRTRAVLLAAVVIATPGCWLQPGGSAGRSYHAPWESTVTSATVDDVVELWRSPMPTTSRGTGPVLAPVGLDGVVYAADRAGGLAAFDLATGAQQWGTEQYLWGADPVIGDPVVLLDSYGLLVPVTFSDADPATSYYSQMGGHHLGVYGGGAPLAIIPDGWAAVATSTPEGGPPLAWLYPANTSVTPMVTLGPDDAIPAYALAGESVLWSEDTDAVAFLECPVYPAPDCTPSWRTPLGDRPIGPAVVGTDAVAYVDVGGTVHVLDLATGAVRFRGEAGGAVSVPPAVANGTILVATDAGRLVAFPADGCGRSVCRPLWKASIGAAPATAPVAGAEVAYVARAGGGIAVFDLAGCQSRRCAPLDVLETGAEVSGGPILEPGRVVAGLADGSVVAYGLDTGDAGAPASPSASARRPDGDVIETPDH